MSLYSHDAHNPMLISNMGTRAGVIKEWQKRKRAEPKPEAAHTKRKHMAKPARSYVIEPRKFSGVQSWTGKDKTTGEKLRRMPSPAKLALQTMELRKLSDHAYVASSYAFTAPDRVKAHLKAAEAHSKAAEAAAVQAEIRPSDDNVKTHTHKTGGHGYYSEIADTHQRLSENHSQLAAQHQETPKGKYVVADTELNRKTFPSLVGREFPSPPIRADVVVSGHKWRDETKIVHEAGKVATPWAKGDSAVYAHGGSDVEGKVIRVIGESPHQRVVFSVGGKKLTLHANHPALRRRVHKQLIAAHDTLPLPTPEVSKSNPKAQKRKPMSYVDMIREQGKRIAEMSPKQERYTGTEEGSSPVAAVPFESRADAQKRQNEEAKRIMAAMDAAAKRGRLTNREDELMGEAQNVPWNMLNADERMSQCVGDRMKNGMDEEEAVENCKGECGKLSGMMNRMIAAYGQEMGERIAVKAYMLANAKVKQYQKRTKAGKVVTVHEHQTKSKAKSVEDRHVEDASNSLADAEAAHDASVKQHSEANHKQAMRSYQEAHNSLASAANASGVRGAYAETLSQIKAHFRYHEAAGRGAEFDQLIKSGKAKDGWTKDGMQKAALYVHGLALKRLNGVADSDTFADHHNKMIEHHEGNADPRNAYDKARNESSQYVALALKTGKWEHHKKAAETEAKAAFYAGQAGMKKEEKAHLKSHGHHKDVMIAKAKKAGVRIRF